MTNPETAPETPRPSPVRRVVKWCAVCLAALAALPLLLSVIFVLIDPPASAYMVQRVLAGAGRHMEWRDLDDISQHLIAGTVANEDARFCAHNGIDWVELDLVLERARENPDARLRGASTITMQTVKNLFLWPQASYVRKAIEIPLAYWFDLVVPKRRILEIYLNIVEWAPGVYGAQAASRHHFDVDASALGRDQAALMVAVLPNPIARNASRPGNTTRRVARRVRQLMAGIDPYLGCL